MKRFISNINVNNFKLYTKLNSGVGLDLNVPDNKNPGSGLTVLIGENNSGKSSIISALSKLRPESRVYEIDKKDSSKKTEIIITDTDKQKIKLENKLDGSILFGYESEADSDSIYRDMEIVKETRVWTSDLQGYSVDHESYKSSFEIERSKVDMQLASRLSGVLKDRTEREAFNTTFKKIIPKFDDWSVSSYSPGAGDRISYQINDRPLDIDTSLGSGMLNLFRIVLALTSESRIIAIDEPEAFIHPGAQKRLAEQMLEISKNKQIIFTTHSPYILEPLLSEKSRRSKIYSFNDKGDVKDISDDINPSLVSWNYISWLVFGVSSSELHIELFDKLMQKSKTKTIYRFNKWIDKASPAKNRSSDSSKKDYGRSSWPTEETLPIWIRNYIHHPELNEGGAAATSIGYYRTKPGKEDVEESIKLMLEMFSA